MADRHPDLSRAVWRKSARSSSTGQNCVEVATSRAGLVAVRDSKDPAGPMLVLSSWDWETFVRRIKSGQFERG